MSRGSAPDTSAATPLHHRAAMSPNESLIPSRRSRCGRVVAHSLVARLIFPHESQGGGDSRQPGSGQRAGVLLRRP
ncbi:hypothetical protein E2C01_039346 [Portunus trituberculatus]|uniref:Uncharacterized protein n=1 Tax=Portunus trituberculatus TaxID=210409 RepID=A0A5B7FDF2_PORTR|nr:hypothetical protein [Portunus trituberculatus]